MWQKRRMTLTWKAGSWRRIRWKLVRMLYQAASAAVREARRHLASGAIAERARSITKAGEVLTELTGSLDHRCGGEISARLSELYGYMNSRLTEAHVPAERRAFGGKCSAC